MSPSASLTTDLSHAAAVLRSGGLVAFATETVYGLGADALRPEAVARIFEAKRRPHFDPLIVHLSEASEVEPLVAEWTPLARQLAEAFWPGPLTLVLPRRPVVPDLVTSGLPSVAVRVPGLESARELIRRAGCPVAAPSANLFGRVSPTTASHVLEQLGDRIDLVLDDGTCRVGIESTIIDLSADRPRLLRPGGTPVEEIEAVIGPVERPSAFGAESRPSAPGQLPQHYAPQTPVRLVTCWDDVPADETAAALGFTSVPADRRFGTVEVLSPSGDLREAAARFFAALRQLDRSGASVIWAEAFPPQGLGLALNDRLQRAAAATLVETAAPEPAL